MSMFITLQSQVTSGETVTQYLIPTTNIPQYFTWQAPDNTTYTLTVKWNDIMQFWFLDVGDIDNSPIVCGIPMVTGADLLGPYAYLDIGCQFFVYNGTNPDLPPTQNGTNSDLGVDCNLYAQVVTNS